MGYYIDEYFRVDYSYYNKKINEILELEKNRIDWTKKNNSLLD